MVNHVKEDAICYKEDHPELTIRKAADNRGVSESALKTWMKAAKDNEGSVPTRGCCGQVNILLW